MKKILIVDDKETIAYLQESNRPRPMYKGELLTNDESSTVSWRLPV